MLLGCSGVLLLLHLLELGPEVLHEGLELAELDRVRKLRLAEDSDEAGDLQLCQLLHANLIAARQEVVSREHLHILLVFKDIEHLHDVIATKGAPHSQVLSKQAL